MQQGVREPTGVAIPARGPRAIPGVVGAHRRMRRLRQSATEAVLGAGRYSASAVPSEGTVAGSRSGTWRLCGVNVSRAAAVVCREHDRVSYYDSVIVLRYYSVIVLHASFSSLSCLV